ncbi:MAG: glycoside hydrolase family 2 TIM barrel-domain containing protein [Flavobacteriia bacterium]
MKVIQEKNKFQITVNKLPYSITGAGGNTNLKDLKSIGGNTIRTWSTENAQQILDEAQANGIMVMMGLWVQHERHGFDYNDKTAIKKQLEGFKKEINKYKNHPALLMWCIGNEYELQYSNINVWQAVNDIAKMAKKQDKNHPIVSVTAGIDDEKIKFIQNKLTAIDILGINTYGDIGKVRAVLDRAKFKKPYMITEWGPTGHWECAKTSWGASIEQTSKEKADSYLQRYTNYIKSDSNQCIGSFTFLWGQKQEYTSTWYGIFHENGQKTEVFDALAACWSPNLILSNNSPKLNAITSNYGENLSNVILKGNQSIEFQVIVSDKENDKLEYNWSLFPESSDLKSGGDAESKPKEIFGLIENDKMGKCTLKAPLEIGKYRLFVSISDGEKIAYANVPFLVE